MEHSAVKERHAEFTLTTPDGASLYYQSWTPEVDSKAVVCLVHGLGEHSGRYMHVAAALNEAGYALLGFDQRGHGRTPGPRGITPTFDRLMDDVGLLLDEAAKRFPGKPRYLYGHSMGGWVLDYAIRCKPEIAGVIATSPSLRLAFKPPILKVAVGKLLYRLAPDMVMPNGLERNALSRDSEVVKAYSSDPLVHDKMSARLGLDILQQGEWAMSHAKEFPAIPLLLVHGTGDRLSSALATAEFASKVSGDCTLKLWPDCYHETHNEPGKAEVLGYMIDWLNRHTPTD